MAVPTRTFQIIKLIQPSIFNSVSLLHVITMFLGVVSAHSQASDNFIDNFSRVDGAIYFTTLSSTSESQLYYERLLKLALDNTIEDDGRYTLLRYPVPMDQSKQIATIKSADADVMWTMSTAKRRREMLAVEFPLLRGMLGKRVFLVSRENRHAFKGLSTEQLKQRIAVQGTGWPDTQVLKNNGFSVSAVAWYDWQFGISKLLTTNVVDYFPRSILEAQAELGLPHNQALTIEPYHLLEYPAYIYFFVNPKKPKLQQRILAGLEAAERNGEFEKLFKSFPSYDDGMAILNENRQVHKLKRTDTSSK